ncbi:uncharacterized protein LOC129601420 [Paramacrobiotus metropolitanus]|uniref:uncharacterized protein LOC129601420 n=1 Tax=Paramacrobiotus metropolitanus TaxID=2943436 RepID=UPI0024462792|nr:uncharacterized protein LOC129601420 [Paramacrobiotus metropolitanus]
MRIPRTANCGCSLATRFYSARAARYDVFAELTSSSIDPSAFLAAYPTSNSFCTGTYAVSPHYPFKFQLSRFPVYFPNLFPCLSVLHPLVGLESCWLTDYAGFRIGTMPLGKLLLLPIHRPEYSLESDSGLYDPFVVDILGASGALMRGYVCDVDEHDVSVRLDAHTVQHAAYGDVWSVKDPDFDESTTDLNSGDIEVRIDLQDSGVAAWTPARLVDSIRWAETEWYLRSSPAATVCLRCEEVN